MKKIFKVLNLIRAKGYYYRWIVTPEHIDIKLYKDRDCTSPETNYQERNDSFGRSFMESNLYSFVNSL